MLIDGENGTLVEFNEMAHKNLGYTREEFAKIKISDFEVIESEEEVAKHIRKIIKEGADSFETKHRTKGGEIRDINTSTRAISIPGKDFIQSICRDITDRKRMEEALKRANEELLKEYNQRKMLSKRLIDLLEKDRRQIAMELHDHIGQMLTSCKIDLEILYDRLEDLKPELRPHVKAIQEKAVQIMKDVKSISHGLRPTMIDTLGVVSSLRDLFNGVQQQTNMEVNFFCRRMPKHFDQGKELAIYRIAQEALTNVIRHARAKNVFVNLVKKDGKLSLSVEDDGVGFDQDKVMKTSKRKVPLGLLIMRERTVQLDGEFIIESQPGKGTHVLVEIPL